MKICTKCGQAKPLEQFFARTAACKTCKTAAIYAWRKKNAARWRNYVRARSQRPRDRARIKLQKASPEARALDRARGQMPAQRERRRLYRLNNKDRHRVYSANKRAKRAYAIAGAKIDPKAWAAKLDLADGRCIYCGTQEQIIMDHVIPLSRGGKHSIENIAPACSPCNGKKFTKTAEEFMGVRA